MGQFDHYFPYYFDSRPDFFLARHRASDAARGDSNGRKAMRTLIIIITASAALALSLAWPSTDATAQNRRVHSYNYCWQLASIRGWEGDPRGGRAFVRRCTQGRPQWT